MEAIGEGTVSVDGVEVFLRRRQGAGTPVVFVHGNPTHSQDWLPFLERLDRPAIALDLPGWGRSTRPADFDYSMHGLARFYAQFLRTLGVQRHSLVVHDWGSLALIAAQREPQQLERLVVIDAVPLLEGYRWHWVARWFWRVPGVGEVFNALTSRPPPPARISGASSAPPWLSGETVMPTFRCALAAPTPGGCPTPTSLQSREAGTGRGSSDRM